jgi:hypothetical protein
MEGFETQVFTNDSMLCTYHLYKFNCLEHIDRHTPRANQHVLLHQAFSSMPRRPN